MPFPTSSRRVVVTGLGLVTPLGIGWPAVWRQLIAGSSGLTSLVAPHSESGPAARGTRGDANPLRNPARDYGAQFADLPSTVAGLVPYGPMAENRFDPAEWLARGDERKMAQFTQFAMAGAELALRDANWKPETESELLRTGVSVGSGVGSIADSVNNALAFQQSGIRKVSPMFVPRTLINMASGHITMKYGFQGPNHAVSTACTTGLHAIGDASRFIMFGDADVMVAGGSEACIHPLTLAGFAKAKSLSTRFNDRPALASRPFDRQRDGFVIGEGCGIVVLEELEHARRRGAPIYAEIKGYGLSGDAHHMTAPPEDGRGARLAMERALGSAGLRPSDIQYINAHATSTPLGDAAENRAIKKLFANVDSSKFAVSSTKGAIGHLLGAAGAVETIFTILAVYNNMLPPTLNYTPEDDPAGEFNLNYVAGEAQAKSDVSAALTNSFGFGGTNGSLCIGKI
ncbi:Mitochondrial beta-keto-acyl synthase [Dimargaris cristalligena]|uniref:3-oxoacyl-[acyl-carrier-protein] synthase n=1 Tax=Dimargaris cristalligena TaxID=215637 RepID=A0A4P9ZQU2_9FUNG|nr:Mitochondrial beta-keto-acyl synthase [Dimargaris cristalligena]RKP35864.1 3-oxoacyl-synthase 2 [Dimargaris cristalligena]|eukprot:RKP35864.1 3-oxoacyl-synthase 2 [Dimargaris cristalligena]